MHDLDIARWRLRTQRLARPHAESADGAVGSLLAVQAENPSQAAWAVAARTRNADQADLATLLDDGPSSAPTCCGPPGTSPGPRTSPGCWT